MKYWYYVEDGKEVGPLSQSEFEGLFLRRKINGSTLVWSKEMSTWAKAAEVTELANLLNVITSEVPPPVPAPPPIPQHSSSLEDVKPKNPGGFSTPIAAIPVAGQPVNLVLNSSCSMEFCWIPPGKCMTGSPKGERGRFKFPLLDWSDKRCYVEPQEPFSCQTGFWLGKFMVTREQWNALMDNDKDKLPVEPPQGDPKFPASFMLFNEILAYISKLNSKLPNYKFRLPTSLEWEYACRAGTSTRYYSGDDDADFKRVGWDNWTSRDCNEVGNFATFMILGSGSMKQPGLVAVGRKEPNNWGLYDMHGLCWEICSDAHLYSGLYAPSSDFLKNEPMHITRGGSYLSEKTQCRSASRSVSRDSVRSGDVSIRLAFTV